jgi:hypothetical protein
MLGIRLLSETTFGASRVSAKDVDIEVELEPSGLPCIGGKTIHGLLHWAWDEMSAAFAELSEAAMQLFGAEGALDHSAIMHISDARIEEPARQWVDFALSEKRVRREQIRDSLTAVRSQTAEDRLTGAAAATTLRRSRVVLRGLTLWAPLAWSREPHESELRCLALAALACRQGGLLRRRGRGRLEVTLDGDRQKTLKLAGLEGIE